MMYIYWQGAIQISARAACSALSGDGAGEIVPQPFVSELEPGVCFTKRVGKKRCAESLGRRFCYRWAVNFLPRFWRRGLKHLNSDHFFSEKTSTNFKDLLLGNLYRSLRMSSLFSATFTLKGVT